MIAWSYLIQDSKGVIYYLFTLTSSVKEIYVIFLTFSEILEVEYSSIEDTFSWSHLMILIWRIYS